MYSRLSSFLLMNSIIILQGSERHQKETTDNTLKMDIMKTNLFLASITIVIICSWINPAKPEFLFLNSDQLKPLGIVLNENGVFYKNLNPSWKQANIKNSCLSFYCSNNNYLTTNHYKESDVMAAKNKNEKLLMKLETTRNDFYPLLIGNPKGEMSLDDETLPVDLKLFPVAICMSETKLRSRKDTIIVWFNPTESLKKALPENIRIEDYLRVRPVNTK